MDLVKSRRYYTEEPINREIDALAVTVKGGTLQVTAGHMEPWCVGKKNQPMILMLDWQSNTKTPKTHPDNLKKCLEEGRTLIELESMVNSLSL